MKANWCIWVAAASVVLFSGCGPAPPIKLGFIGGLSDRASDASEAARNGLILATEERNQAGGIGGRAIELLVHDDGQNREKAVGAIEALVAAKVEAIVGPFTSAMAAAVLPAVNEARVVMVSPTITSTDFHGKDDFLIRLNRTTRDNAQDYARVLHQRGQKRIAVAYDTGNASFSNSWMNEFRAAHAALGGSLAIEVPYESRAIAAFGDIARSMVEAKPDGLLFIANTVDVARLAQQANKLAPQLPKTASEWAESESLLELGGQAVEGLLIAQSYDRTDTSGRYKAFRDAFVARFGREPGHSSVATYDAARVILQALENRRGGESLKEAILKHGPYEGLQQRIEFDRHGDTQRIVFFAEIRAGKFELLK